MSKLRPAALSGLSAAYALVLAALPSLPAHAQTPAAHAPVHFVVQAPANLTAPLSGRLLLFLKAGHGDKAVDNDVWHMGSTWVGAREVHDLSPGASVEIDPDAADIAFPTPFASIPTGDYEVQAVLDVDHSYNYSGRGPQDWVSPVVSLSHWTPGAGAEPTLELTEHAPENAAPATPRA